MSTALVTELEAALALLDTALAEAKPREVAALLRERRITLNEIDALAGPEEGSIVDELTRRRQGRRADAGLEPGTGNKRKQRG